MRDFSHIDRFLPLSTIEAFERDRAAERAAVAFRKQRKARMHAVQTLDCGCTVYWLVRPAGGDR